MRCHRVVERRPEARPAGVAVELGTRRKGVELASGARERAATMFVVQGAAIRTFCAFVPKYVVLRRRQQAAPLVIRVNHLERFIGGATVFSCRTQHATLIECGKRRCRKNAACKNKPAPGLHDVLLNKANFLRKAVLCMNRLPGRYREPRLGF